MKNPNFVLLYVKDPAASAAFYTRLLGRPAVDASENFAMLPLTGDVMLGLWAMADVQPSSVIMGGGSEIGFPAESHAAVDACHREWSAQRLAIAQPPTQMDFGYTFVALDPDGHRLRVFHPNAG